MTKTAKQIIGDLIELLSGELLSSISGKVYRSGYRPEGSKKEDLVVIFTTGTPNIYVPDIPHKEKDKEVYVENGRRCEELEVIAQEWVSGLNKGVSMYYFTLQQTIYTEVEEEINQHFVVVKLKYELLTD